MSSNCYIVYDDEMRCCFVVDPASEKCLNEIGFIERNHLKVNYIILTHEHTDHTWGCNTLIDKYDAKVICSEACKKALPREGRAYFLFYYDNPDYTYSVKRVDVTVEDLNYELHWNSHTVKFIPTPGHSKGSVCFSIGNFLFTGDTLMQYKPFVNKRSGSVDELNRSIVILLQLCDEDTTVYPGHGDVFRINDYNNELQ